MPGGKYCEFGGFLMVFEYLQTDLNNNKVPDYQRFNSMIHEEMSGQSNLRPGGAMIWAKLASDAKIRNEFQHESYKSQLAAHE